MKDGFHRCRSRISGEQCVVRKNGDVFWMTGCGDPLRESDFDQFQDQETVGRVNLSRECAGVLRNTITLRHVMLQAIILNDKSDPEELDMAESLIGGTKLAMNEVTEALGLKHLGEHDWPEIKKSEFDQTYQCRNCQKKVVVNAEASQEGFIILPSSGCEPEGRKMSEIKTPVEKLPEGVPYTPGPDEYVITEKHTISDIVSFAASFSDMSEVHALSGMALEEK